MAALVAKETDWRGSEENGTWNYAETYLKDVHRFFVM